jgi:LPXTG-site transpeptidase (sortase) family protein
MVTPNRTGDVLVTVNRTTRRRRVYWTLGNLLAIAGLYLLFYVGGVYSEIAYHRMAARGDSDIAALQVLMDVGAGQADISVTGASVALPSAAPAALPAFEAPALAGQSEAESGAAPKEVRPALVQRIVIPSIKVDSKVIEVGWEVVEQNGQHVAVWQVAEYAVGQHRGSANPGEGGNIVLAGHVGGYGKVFRDLFYVRPGEPVVLYSEGRQFLYTVKERLVVTEEGVSPEQRAENARLIAPTDYEVVTLVTCWPLTGPQKYTQRVIIRAVPYAAVPPPVGDVAHQTAR